MKGLFAWVGFNAIGVPYERPQRAAGSSKFNLWRLWNFALDGVVSFSTVPLRASFYGGAGDRGDRRALRPVHHRPRADLRHRHAGLRLAVDRRAAAWARSSSCRSASSASISAACSSRSRAGRSTSSRASTKNATHAEGLMDLKEEDILGADIGRHWYYRSKAAALRRMVGGLAAAAPARCRRGLGLLLPPSAGRTGAQSALCVDIGYERDRDETRRRQAGALPPRLRRRPTATSC